MKQTAVEFLYEALSKEPKDIFMWQIILQQAKEMEREQITDSYDQGICEGFDYGYHNDNPKEESGEEYYNKTYGIK
jgi:hypothetical protein